MKNHYLSALFKILVTAALCLSLSNKAFSQKTHVACPASARSIKDFNTARWPVVPHSPSIAWAGPVIYCGAFAIYYDDLNPNTGKGFNDPLHGTCYQNTFCQVLSYISTLIDFSKVTSHGGHVTIHVQSWEGGTYPPHPYSNALALGGPQFGYAGSNWPNQGIYDGKAFDHITTGIDPDSTQFDGTITINFDGATANGGPFIWACDTNSLTNCTYDFYSVILHEMTHFLGFLSNIGIDSVSDYPIASIHNNYTLYDWTYLYQSSSDLYWNNSSPGWTHLLGGTMAAPVLNAVNPIQSNIWAYNTNQFGGPNSANTNQPVYSGMSSYEKGAGGWDLPTSYLSHMDLSTFSYTTRSSAAPGLQEDYVMGPASFQGDAHRKWTVPEMRMLAGLKNGANHYTFNASLTINGISPDNSIISNNHPPYNKKQNTDGYYILSGYDGVYPDYYYIYTTPPLYPNFYQPIDTVISNSAGSNTYSYNVTLDPNIGDPDGDPVTIVPYTLYNIRGCGTYGNDHGQLSLNAAHTIVTYTARPDFVGIAQFGFYITDGKEAGAYVVKTIKVKTGNLFVNKSNQNTQPTCAGCKELVVNGDWEQGIETKTTPLKENNFNTNELNGTQEGNYYTGTQFADAHPLEWVSTSTTAIGGCIINGAYKDCSTGTVPYYFGNYDYTNPSAGPLPIPSPKPPLSGPDSNFRFHWLRGSSNYCTLASSAPNQNNPPVQNCTPYILTFDINFATALHFNPGLSTYTFTVGFTGSVVQPPAANTYTFSFQVTVTPSALWQTISVPFWYCGATPSGPTGYTFLNFDCDNNYVFVDNISLVYNPNPPPMALSISSSNNNFCAGGSATLTPTVKNPSCSVLYSWSTGATTSSITVNPAATTIYTLTVSDGCGLLSPVTTEDTVKVDSAITLAYTYTNVTNCTGKAIINVSGGTKPYTFKWSTGQTTDSLSSMCPGNYCCTVTDFLGCHDSICLLMGGPNGVGELTSNSGVTIIPNPNNGRFQIQANSYQPLANSSVEIYNMLGEKVYSQTLSTQHSTFNIDCGSNPTGIYLYRVTTQAGSQLAIGKFIIQK